MKVSSVFAALSLLFVSTVEAISIAAPNPTVAGGKSVLTWTFDRAKDPAEVLIFLGRKGDFFSVYQSWYGVKTYDGKLEVVLDAGIPRNADGYNLSVRNVSNIDMVLSWSPVFNLTPGPSPPISTTTRTSTTTSRTSTTTPTTSKISSTTISTSKVSSATTTSTRISITSTTSSTVPVTTITATPGLIDTRTSITIPATTQSTTSSTADNSGTTAGANGGNVPGNGALGQGVGVGLVGVVVAVVAGMALAF